MSGTRRTPIIRRGTPQISPRALKLFEQAEKARLKRRGAACAVGPYGHCSLECAACRDWSNAHNELHKELGLRPWEWPCLPINPFPPGSINSRDWQPEGEELLLWQTLEKARRAALAVSAGAPEASIQSGSTITTRAAK